MSYRFRTISAVFCILLFLAFSPVYAQDDGLAQALGSPSDDTSENVEELFVGDSSDLVTEITGRKHDGYVTPDPKSLSQMYWGIGKFDVMEDKLIDYYLMINECQMYLKYYHNDFEWLKIREATKKYIKDNISNFPTRFEILTELSLGRYDEEKEEFDIKPESKIMGLKRLNYGGYDRTIECNMKGRIMEYPPGIVVILGQPFTLDKVPVPRELARLYIEEAKSFFEGIPEKAQMRRYERLAFLRMKVRVVQYKETAMLANGTLRAFVFGVLEGYEIYADPEMKKPLHSDDFTKKRFKRLRRRHDADEEAATDGGDE